MFFTLTNYIKQRKFLLVCLYSFFCAVLMSVMYFIANDLNHLNDSYYYTNDFLVNSIAIVNIVCISIVFLTFVYKILFELKIVRYNIPMVNRLIVIVVCGFLIAFLIWYEFYYVTLFYQGEVKILTGYLIGSSVLMAISITVIVSTKFKHISILFFIFAILSYFIYECQLAILAQYMDLMSISF
ncbi:MAG: hypothetical protein K1X86_13940 [Ignavibacteria bacterium]|nr:hypothetical protein [Ignavibacteria bacterium]